VQFSTPVGEKFSLRGCKAVAVGVIEEWSFFKNLKGSGRGVVKVLSQNLFIGTEENYEKHNS
jgi:hypothetical protein